MMNKIKKYLMNKYNIHVSNIEIDNKLNEIIIYNIDYYNINIENEIKYIKENYNIKDIYLSLYYNDDIEIIDEIILTIIKE